LTTAKSGRLVYCVYRNECYTPECGVPCPRWHRNFTLLEFDMCAARKDTSRYKLETVARACTILRHFAEAQRSLSLSEVVEGTGFERTIVFRLLRTLEEEGLLRRPEGRRYLSNVNIVSQKRFRIGYASQNSDSFSRAVAQGIRWAAARHQIDLIEVENLYSAKAALRNAQKLADQKVDLAIEFQVYERIGAQLSAIYEKAGIPVIAIEIPQPGATFFGIDNYNVGQLAGKALVKAAQQHWRGEIDELLMLDLEIAGSLPHLRISGAETAVRKSLTGSYQILHLDSRGEMERSFGLVRRHLQFSPKRKTLICGVNDLAVLGALRAFAEVGRSNYCLALGVGAFPEARRELRSPQTRMIGSIATFPERYGDNLIQIVLDILHKRPVPPAVYAPIQLVTPQNIDKYYPGTLFAAADKELHL
jgi:ribose transport system substrate-binding protein